MLQHNQLILLLFLHSYRSGTDVKLSATLWTYDANEFLNKTTGEPLSDHVPVKAVFTIA
jgi:DNA polymerase IIIc chi subunit